jgi:effector-binding domain-containing protein
MLNFFQKNKMRMHGPPFVAYDYFDDEKGLAKFSVCIPIAEEVFIQPGSDVHAGKFASFHAAKTTLKGDYSHLKEAWDKTFAHIDDKKLEYSENGNYLETYKVGKPDEKRPSQWVTEIYIPVKAVAAVPVTITQPATPTVSAPTEAPGDSPDAEISIP